MPQPKKFSLEYDKNGRIPFKVGKLYKLSSSNVNTEVQYFITYFKPEVIENSFFRETLGTDSEIIKETYINVLFLGGVKTTHGCTNNTNPAADQLYEFLYKDQHIWIVLNKKYEKAYEL
jgi:hypothetical protein